MATTNLNIRTDKDVKEQADRIFSELGLNMTTAIYHERNQSIKATLMRGRRARYDEFWALKDVNLEIASGQTFGLVSL